MAFLVDGAAYFDAFVDAAEKALHSIIILAWDFHGGVCMRADEYKRPNTRVDEFLNDLVARRRGLRVYVLDWDYPLLYAIERQFLAAFRFQWWTHPRFQFRLDRSHATGGSHHQKVVVIDDAIAFVGGIDFAPGRWDTPNHCCDDPRRCSPSGEPLGPYHDLMVAVDGDAAAALGDLARDRWHRATGKRLRPALGRAPLWPESLATDLSNVEVSIARTDPVAGTQGEVREIETLYLDAIAAARRWIYIENQYLTAENVGTALCRRLQEADGPEVVIITTQVCGGWLEEGTMGVLRARLVERLRAADRFDHLRLFTPVVPNLTESRYTVHAKAMIVDDDFVRVGSANLNNRSMGLDTECDLAIEAEGNATVAAGIAAFRACLLGEHLDREPEIITAQLDETGSLIAAIDALRGGEHSLVPLDPAVPAWLEGLIPEAEVVDPDRPIDAQLIESIAPVAPDMVKRSRRWVVVLLGIVALSAAWSIMPIRPWAAEMAADWFANLNGQPMAPLVVVGAFLCAAFLFVPVTIVLLATGMAFGPWQGALYACVGALASALAGYAVGRLLGRDIVRRLAGRKLEQLRLRLARHGVIAVAAVRLLPLAPFTVVNMVAGMAGIRMRDFILGTLMGMGPPIMILTVFGDRLAHATRHPTLVNVLVAVVLALALAAIGLVWGERFARGAQRRTPRRRLRHATRAIRSSRTRRPPAQGSRRRISAGGPKRHAPTGSDVSTWR